MSIASFSIKQRVLVNLITVAVVIVGTLVTLNMRREAMPAIEIDYIFISTVYPGASPEEVEELITMPIEDELKNIDGIDTYSSGSREGMSFIFIELEPDLPNRDRVINEISREVDKVDLPDDAEDPDVEELVLEHQLMEVAFSGEGAGEEKLRQYAKNFEERIKNLKNMGTIDRIGWRDREISIEVDPGNLDRYYISLAQVINSIQNQNLNLPGGKMKSGTKELILRTIGEMDNPQEFGDVIIRTNSDGKYLYVRDVASIKETFEDREIIYKTNGTPSISLIPKKKKAGDTIKLVDEIKREISLYKKTIPENVSISVINDMAFYVKRRLNVLVSNGQMGMVLLIITLLAFLNARIALVTAVGIPFAFLTALIFMSFFDVGLNLITMFGLILVIGMIVDDAIVISENVYRHMEDGVPVKEAVVRGVDEVAAPVTATILTTIAAFLPLMFISGIMGKFLRYFPMGVIFCLSASLFEALVILPTHLADWVRPLKTKDELGINGSEKCEDGKRTGLWKTLCIPFTVLQTVIRYIFSHERKGSEAGWFRMLLGGYSRLLGFCVDHRYKFGAAAAVVLIAAVIFSVKVMPFKLFPDMIEIFYVRIEMPEGTSLDVTNRALSRVEEIAMDLPDDEMENITATVGFQGEIGGGPFDKYGTQYGQCVVYLTPEQSRKRNADEIISDLRDRITSASIRGIVNLQFEKIENGPPVGKPVAVEIRGDEYETLVKITEEIKAYLGTLEGVEDIKDDYELDKEEIRISIDKREAARLGLNVRQIAGTIRYAFEGGVATTMRKGDEDIEVIVRLPEKYRNNMDTLKDLTIPNDMGRLIRLKKVASFNKGQGVMTLSHNEGRRAVTTTASINENKTTSIAANRKIKQKFSDIGERYPGYTVKIGGEWEDTTESVSSIFRAFAIAFMLIYIILATQFKSFIQPLIIMTSVPFGIIGVIAALYLHGQPVSMMALFGIVGLTGVVVNDALILIDFINKRRAQGLAAEEAVIEAGRTRLRPILLTSITTIIALLPLIYGIGGEEPFLVPSAIAMAYGLLAATFLTLVIVPCVYLIVEDIGVRFSKGRIEQSK
ncbi:MAG: efflux RND transporter permease subunit [Elusimicrobia bacterium]|nr:efflux RND transporter permease subunit [Elusimicrobiota bacterium]